MVASDVMNYARFRKRFLITFFEPFSENRENSCSCHENSFGYYANRHLRTYDLKLILQTRHRPPTLSGWRFSIILCFIIFFHRKNVPIFSPFIKRGVFDWIKRAAAGTIPAMSQIFTFFLAHNFQICH